MKKLITKIKAVISTENSYEKIYIKNTDGKFEITSEGKFYLITLHTTTNSENGVYVTTSKELKKVISEDLFANISDYLTKDDDGKIVINSANEDFKQFYTDESLHVAYDTFKKGYTGRFNPSRNLCNFMFFDKNQILCSDGHYLSICDADLNNVDFMLHQKICDSLFKLKTDFDVRKGHLFDDTIVTVECNTDDANFLFYIKYDQNNHNSYIQSFRNLDLKTDYRTITIDRKEFVNALKDIKTLNAWGGVHLTINDNKLLISAMKYIKGDEYQDLNTHALQISKNNLRINEFDLVINKDYLESLVKNQTAGDIELLAYFTTNYKGETYCDALHLFCEGFKAKIMRVVI